MIGDQGFGFRRVGSSMGSENGRVQASGVGGA